MKGAVAFEGGESKEVTGSNYQLATHVYELYVGKEQQLVAVLGLSWFMGRDRERKDDV